VQGPGNSTSTRVVVVSARVDLGFLIPSSLFETLSQPSFSPWQGPRLVLYVVGVYLNPPQHAVVLCVDEKCQIQALDRTQPGLPLKKGRCGTWTHDYVRHGTTTLFAALNAAIGNL
jgi:hypothetical protein